MTHIRFDDDDGMDAEPSPMQHAITSTRTHAQPPAPMTSAQLQGTHLLTPHCCTRVRVDYNSADPAYVFRLVFNPATQMLAASTSSNIVKLYTLQPGASNAGRQPVLTHLGNLEGHSNSITGLEYGPEQPALVYSSSADGTVRVWDTRTGQQAQGFSVEGQQLLCVGIQEQLVAAGGQGEVFFWDKRSGKPLAKLEDTHMDDVTQVQFCPSSSKHVISGSLDGLVAVHDTSHAVTHDDAFVAAINVNTSVEELGTYGDHDSRLWVRTGTETLHLWEWSRTAAGDVAEEGGEGAFAAFEEARDTLTQAAQAAGGVAAQAFPEGVGYIAGCHYDAGSRRLMVVAGSEGNVGFWPLVEQPCASGSGAMVGAAIAQPVTVLAGAHSAVVRSIVCGEGLGAGVCCVTGGEDAQICLWSLDPSIGVAAEAASGKQGHGGRKGGSGGRGGGGAGQDSSHESGGVGPLRGAGGGGRHGGQGQGRGKQKGRHGSGDHKQNMRPSPY